MKKSFSLLIGLVLLIGTGVSGARAQGSANDSGGNVKLSVNATDSTITSASPRAPQSIVASLANLPEADALIYLNTQRILNEVLPKFMPAKDLEEMRKGFEEAKKSAGIDPSKIDYMVLAIRFKKPTGDLNFQAPELMVVSGGDFSADSLLVLARLASGGKLRDESYGGKTLGLMTIDPIVKEAEKNPMLKAFTEVGVVALNANTIASGTPGYLRAAIDAGAGKGRISTEALNSLIRDPDVLMSFAGSPWHSFAKSFGMLGTETTERTPKCESKIGDAYVALTMEGDNFSVRGISNADNPDTAKILANLYSGLLKYATGSVPDEATKSLLKGIAISAEGDEVMLRADFSQQTIMDMMKKGSSSLKAATDVMTTTTPKAPAKKRRTRRRR
ncbi:MAG TPA: hypothetical protein VLL54_11695 [Pyrinomonadaceae bacterium]|nr:hypothetical protein [Pyrinomonadaceae bacterium]